MFYLIQFTLSNSNLENNQNGSKICVKFVSHPTGPI